MTMSRHVAARISVTSQLLSCWHLKSDRERLGMNGMISVYLRLREDSITNEQWYFAMTNITRGWIHVRDDRFCPQSFGKWRHNYLAHATCTAKNVFDLFSLAKCLTCNGMSLESWYCENIKKWCYIKVYRLKFLLKQHVFVLHVTSVNTGSVQVMQRAVGARTMHSFGTDLVSNPAIWLVESRD